MHRVQQPGQSVALLQSILRHLVGFSGNNDAILYCFTLWSKSKQARESMNTPGQLTLSAFTRFHIFVVSGSALAKRWMHTTLYHMILRCKLWGCSTQNTKLQNTPCFAMLYLIFGSFSLRASTVPVEAWACAASFSNGLDSRHTRAAKEQDLRGILSDQLRSFLIWQIQCLSLFVLINIILPKLGSYDVFAWNGPGVIDPFEDNIDNIV